jgi:hypothetical protein
VGAGGGAWGGWLGWGGEREREFIRNHTPYGGPGRNLRREGGWEGVPASQENSEREGGREGREGGEEGEMELN